MKNIAFVLGSFHKEQVTQMLESGKHTAKNQNLNIVDEVWVPGSMEKPIIIKHLLKKKEIDGVVILGIIERGETKHGFIMGDSVIKACIDLQLEFEKPIGVGIIGPEVFPSQIEPRIASYAQKAVMALSQMFKLLDD